MAAGIAMGIAVARPQIWPAVRLGVNLNRKSVKWVLFSPSASSSYSSSSSSSAVPRTLILYSKPGCCLCDGLKEKLDAAFALSGPNSLHDVQLQIRDITSNPEWERLYQYEIPVLARVHDDGTEETLPRLSPRLGVELIQKKIAAAFSQ
ncbi:Thioredoxin superfamily protein [Abeliophyllum distichum]|uniref:Glutaredoxin-like protein n=1 Tax=Abeliophyllum distichum TaxID=126358 RepID=A0ABD1TKB4_9LAMI